ELADLGWLGLHLDETYGGGGFGLSEMAIVLEEAGRAAMPGPLLPTVAAGALLSTGAAPVLRARVLPLLASGQAVAAVAFPATSRLVAEEAGGALSVSGVARPVLAAGLADWLILAATKGDGEVWCAIPRVEAAVTALASLDP